MPRTISHDEFLRFLSAVDKPAYRLCFSLMYSCGLRISEAISIKPPNIDSTKMSIRVIGKGNKEGIVPFPKALLRPMREYWKTHRNREWLFPARHGRGHMSTAALRTAFRSACDRVGIDRDVKAHALRHSYATRLLENGANIREVQILLRHASISSTQIYMHLTEPLRNGIKQRINNLFSDLL